MEKTDVLVIGGSAAGIVAATTAKSFHPDKSVLLVRRERSVMVPCGIPYVFGTLEACDENQIPDAAVTNAGVALEEAEITSVDLDRKVCTAGDGREFGFEKLVFATGSLPKEPTWLPGAESDDVYVVPKDRDYLEQLLGRLPGMTDIVVIGAGFIGVEVADEMRRAGKHVTLVETLPHVLGLAFDAEFASRAEEILTDRGIALRLGTTVERIDRVDGATRVVLGGGELLKADAVVVAVGYVPNTDLAKRAGCELNKYGFIQVNEYMRTENPDVFAVGDCAEKYSFVTRTLKPLMLASTACAEARIAAMNLFRLSTLRCFGGTISIFSTAIGENGFGAAGVTENLARERGFETLTATFEGVDRHPGTLPDTHKQVVKLIASRDSATILGGEVFGGKSTGELTNLIGLAIQNRMTAFDLLTSQIGTHPLLTGPPTAYPLIKAAEMIAKQQRAS
jgi:NADPH-dependent 2,4-dienoyl-CoA reductase/sulfur reductase-like enzyme